MKIIITGASGFIGRTVARHLIAAGHELVIIARASSALAQDIRDASTIIIYDLTNLEPFVSAVRASEATHVLHLATNFLSRHNPADIKPLLDANVTFGTHLLEAISTLSIQSFINTTTYATSVDGLGYLPQNLYAATKKAFEDILFFYCAEQSYKVINLTLYDTYGPSDTRPKIINLIVDAARSGQVLNMSPGEQEICYTHVNDTARAILISLSSQFESLWSNYCVYGPETFRLIELVNQISVIMGAQIKVNPGFYDYRPREIMRFNPPHPILPNFRPEFTLQLGIASILEESND